MIPPRLSPRSDLDLELEWGVQCARFWSAVQQSRRISVAIVALVVYIDRNATADI